MEVLSIVFLVISTIITVVYFNHGFILLPYVDANLEKLLALPDSSLCFSHVATELENKPGECKRAGGASWSRLSGIHSKRNRTIGLGEHEQLDLMVTESVIRWSSCTHLPTSLRSSLVC